MESVVIRSHQRSQCMDEETKKFFEELSHASEEITLEEPQIELAKTASPLKQKVMEKVEKSEKSEKKETPLAELMEESEGQLTIDVYQTPDEIVVESTIAGVEPENLDVDITPESVTIRGKREKEKRVAEENYYYQECYWGKFSRSVILPQEIDPEKSAASLKNGVLTIRMPKLDRQKTKKIKVSLT